MTGRDAVRFRKGDAAVILIVIAAALAMILGMALRGDGGGTLKVQVWQDGQLIRELPLAQDAEFTLEGAYTNTVTLRDGRAAITQSDCPGEDCVHTGWISRSGRSVVCLPNRVEIRITGGGAEDELDAVAR